MAPPHEGWNVDTLKEYVDMRFHELERERDATGESIKAALQKTETYAEKRFESVDGFRAQLTDQAASFMTREEYDAKHEALGSRVSAVEDMVQTMIGSGQGAQKTLTTFLTTTAIIVTIVVAAVTIIFTR